MADETERIKPVLARLFETAAAAMGLDLGYEELRLEFEDGHLRRWSRADQRNGAYELVRFDESARAELEQSGHRFAGAA